LYTLSAFPFFRLPAYLSFVPSDIEGVTKALADKYAIERELGRGGMATVYLAHDRKHNRPVAINEFLDRHFGPVRR
jgi:serine/threonine protein kinase